MSDTYCPKSPNNFLIQEGNHFTGHGYSNGFAVGFPNSFMAIFRAPFFFSVGSVLIVPILPLMWVPPTFRKFTPQATLRRVYLKMTGSRLAAIDPDVLMKLPWFMKINQQMVGLNNRNGGIIGTQWDIWYRECIWINEITTSRLATWTRNGA